MAQATSFAPALTQNPIESSGYSFQDQFPTSPSYQSGVYNQLNVAPYNQHVVDMSSAANGGDSGSGLEEEFTCGVCYDMLVLPTTLNCGHSFCRPCLSKWFAVDKKAECPTCRQVR